MKNIKRPAFIMGIIGAILLFVGLGYKTTNDRAGDVILYLGMALGGIFWIWSIFAVINALDMKPYQKRFWLISVIAVPIVGALVFYILHQEKDKIVT